MQISATSGIPIRRSSLIVSAFFGRDTSAASLAPSSAHAVHKQCVGVRYAVANATWALHFLHVTISPSAAGRFTSFGGGVVPRARTLRDDSVGGAPTGMMRLFVRISLCGSY